jgi:hypothetical protein
MTFMVSPVVFVAFGAYLAYESGSQRFFVLLAPFAIVLSIFNALPVLLATSLIHNHNFPSILQSQN